MSPAPLATVSGLADAALRVGHLTSRASIPRCWSVWLIVAEGGGSCGHGLVQRLGGGGA